MVQPIEQRDVAIDLIKPAPVIMTNLLNLTHTTRPPRAWRSGAWEITMHPPGQTRMQKLRTNGSGEYARVRTCPEIIESTFERVKYGSTTERSYCRGGDGNRHGAEHDRAGSEGIGAGRTIGAGSAAGGGTQAGDCQGPDIGRGSRGVGRTDDAGGSGIAVAVDLQKRATIGRSVAAAGPPGEPHPGGRIAQCDGLQPARKPQDQGG